MDFTMYTRTSHMHLADEIRYAIHILIFMYTRGHKIRRQNVYDSMHRVLLSELCVWERMWRERDVLNIKAWNELFEMRIEYTQQH